MQWGDFNLELVCDGTFRLDGGAMFGVVPKPLWEKVAPPDESNRITLGLNCLLIQSDRGNLLIDTGCGQKYSDKEVRIYRIENSPGIIQRLQSLGIQPEEIDFVINTHLHFDHCGGNTQYSGEDEKNIEPAFPNACYVVRQQELEAAEHPNERTRATYFAHNWESLRRHGLLKVIDKDQEIIPGVRCILTPGHTAGHQSVQIESGGNVLLYIADLCPTVHHVPLPWIMGYDLFPLTTLKTRKRVYRQAMEGNWILFFEHDPVYALGRLKMEEGKYQVEPQLWNDELNQLRSV